VSASSTFLETLAKHSREVRGPAGDFKGQNVVIEYRWAVTQYDQLSGDCRQVPQVGAVDTVLHPVGREAERSELKRAFCSSLSEP
jgi:hypothetical protein